MGPLSVLGFEPYDAGSHRSVRELITRFSRHRWTWLTRPGRGWKWRMRLAAVELIEQARARGVLDRPVDAIFATSLLGAADLRALLPPPIRSTPLILYMHENQAAYPWSSDPRNQPDRDVHFAVTNLTSGLAADRVIWNSRWNRDSFLSGMDTIVRKASASDLRCWRQAIEDRSEIVWPPVEAPPPGAGGTEGVLHNGTRVVWPHRWEHDKGPEELLEIAERHSETLDLRWTILGEQFPQTPQPLLAFRQRHAGRIDHMGYEPDRARYWALLAAGDWVLSTARHEFFGIAVVEALLAGCLPWLPDRLSYPELLPDEARGLSPAAPPADRDAVIEAVRGHLEPALAPNAVAAIDEAIERTVRQAAESG